MSPAISLTRLAQRFLEPANATHRAYEALRAYCVEGLTAREAAARFGYTHASFRVLVHRFRQNPERDFFLPPTHGPHAAPKKDAARETIIRLRKQNLSIYDISRALAHDGLIYSPVSVAHVLQEEGFARLPRRRDDERPPGVCPTVADVADVRALDLESRSFRTQFGGLFLFLQFLAQMPFERLLRRAELPGSAMNPAGCAWRALLGLKLFG